MSSKYLKGTLMSGLFVYWLFAWNHSRNIFRDYLFLSDYGDNRILNTEFRMTMRGPFKKFPEFKG